MTSTGPGWVGRTLGNRYKIEAILGRGGMSSVYRAHDPNLNRKVAVKIIHQHLTDNAEFIQRFEQEAALIAQLRHPNIIQVHDFNHDDNTYYMIMEFIPGETLSHRLEALKNAGMRLPLSDTVSIMTKICGAVDYAHQRRMIHRDLKPANVMLDLLGEPTLMDFGIARMVGVQTQPTPGMPMGTAAYMSPELIRGEEADHRSDIYSLGIMLYEMLSGDPPFHDDSTYQVMVSQVNDPLPDIQAVEMNTPHSLVAIVERALEKEPDDRFQTAGEMSNTLNAIGLQLQGPADNLATRRLDRLGLMWQQARDLFDERQWSACIDKLDEIKRTDLDFQHQKVTSLREEALDRLIKQAEREYDAGEFAASLAAIETVREYDSEFPIDELEFKVRMSLQQADLRTQLEDLYAEAAACLDARDYEKALAKWISIQNQKENLDFPDSLMVEKRAREGLCTGLYAEAISALAQNDPEKALARMVRIGEVDPQFPDSQNVLAQANEMLSQKKRPVVLRTYALWAVAVLVLLLLIGGGVIFLPGLLGEQTAVTPTSDQNVVAVAQPTDTETAPPPTEITPTITPTNTTTPTSTSTNVPTETPTVPPPTFTPTTNPSPTPTETAEPEIPYRATVIDNVSLFAQPDAGSEEIAVIMADDEVWVLGRSENGNWLFVSDMNDVQGFAIAERINWSGDINTLPVRSETVAEAEPTRNSTPSGGELELNLYQLDGTQQCNGEAWSILIFIEGHGGDGNYSYFWNDTLLAESTNDNFTFSVSSGGGPIIGTGRVTSGDGLSLEKELFLNKPDCNNG